MKPSTFETRYLLALLFLLLVAVVLSGVGAHYPQDWWLENALVFLLVGAAFVWRKQALATFSLTSWTLVFLFLCVHELGAHWTYSEVPYREWWAALTGASLPDGGVWAGRNYFDRMVHLFYGLVLVLPIRELLVATSPLKRGFWSYFIPVDIIMSTSMVYELIEWLAAEVFGGELGLAYNGSQGDVWDAQKDMALATLGAVIAILAIWFAHRRKRSDRDSQPPANKSVLAHQDA